MLKNYTLKVLKNSEKEPTTVKNQSKPKPQSINAILNFSKSIAYLKSSNDCFEVGLN